MYTNYPIESEELSEIIDDVLLEYFRSRKTIAEGKDFGSMNRVEKFDHNVRKAEVALSDSSFPFKDLLYGAKLAATDEGGKTAGLISGFRRALKEFLNEQNRRVYWYKDTAKVSSMASRMVLEWSDDMWDAMRDWMNNKRDVGAVFDDLRQRIFLWHEKLTQNPEYNEYSDMPMDTIIYSLLQWVLQGIVRDEIQIARTHGREAERLIFNLYKPRPGQRTERASIYRVARDNDIDVAKVKRIYDDAQSFGRDLGAQIKDDQTQDPIEDILDTDMTFGGEQNQ